RRSDMSAATRAVFARLESGWDELKAQAAAKLGRADTPLIQPFRGFGTRDELWVRARVLEDEGVISAVHSDSLWTNIKHTYKRYETDEIADARVRWTYGSQSGEETTDAEGYVDFTIQPGADFDGDAARQEVMLQLVHVPGHDIEPLTSRVHVRTPDTNAADFGIISDIDDTIVYTGATNFAKHWRTVVANSAESRQGYDHLPELYRALTDEERNPIFFVSSSPWNLFDLFERYMVLNDIPLGPMLLKDFGLDDDKWLTGGHDGHKTKNIERVLSTYPQLPFLLVGDSGQRDLAIYSKVVRDHPGRIKAVVIHDVTTAPNSAEAEAQLKTIRDGGALAIHTGDYGEAWDRLAEHGLAPSRG
ncbi:MAG: phosphatase domain-containing protein, partial [Pseudomonadota bacterium]